MPNVSFMAVGPLTDNDDTYFEKRGLGNREHGVCDFGKTVAREFGYATTETIMAPKDIAFLPSGFFDTRSPVTPAVRPVGLPGNEANDSNALNVAGAIHAGSSAIIVASPIMRSPDKMDAATRVLDQIGEAREVT